MRMRAHFSLGMMREDSNVFKVLEGGITVNLGFCAQQMYLSKTRVNHFCPVPPIRRQDAQESWRDEQG